MAPYYSSTKPTSKYLNIKDNSENCLINFNIPWRYDRVYLRWLMLFDLTICSENLSCVECQVKNVISKYFILLWLQLYDINNSIHYNINLKYSGLVLN